MNKNYESLKGDPDKAWLVEWRDRNCPKARVQQTLEARLPQLIQELVSAKESTKDVQKLAAIDNGLEILHKIQDQVQHNVSGKRLLLESAILIPSVVLNPSEKDLQRINTLSDKLSINPVLNVIGGLLKAFAGAIVYAFTKGAKEETLNSGLATMHSGVEIDSRRDLQSQMKGLIKGFKAEAVEVQQVNEEALETRPSNAM